MRFLHIITSCLVTLLLLSSDRLLAQDDLDTLYTIWLDKSQEDSLRTVSYYNYIRKGFLFSQPDTAAVMAEDLIDFAEEYQYPKARSFALFIKGVSAARSGQYEKALEHFESALELRRSMGDIQGIASSLNDIGTVYSSQNKYVEALDYFERSLAIKESLKNKRSMASSLVNIGIIFRKQGDLTRALNYYKRGLKIVQDSGDERMIAAALNNIGNIYLDLEDYTNALDYFERGLTIFQELRQTRYIANVLHNIGIAHTKNDEPIKGLAYFNRSLTIKEDVNDRESMVTTLVAIGTTYMRTGDDDLALEYYQRSLELLEEVQDKISLTETLIGTGQIYSRQKRYTSAVDQCKRGLLIAEEIGTLPEQKEACECLYDIYKEMGQGEKALFYLEKSTVLDDSLRVEEITKNLQRLEFEKQILADSINRAEEANSVLESHRQEVLQKNRARNFIIILGLMAAFLAVAFYTRWMRTKRSSLILQEQKDRSDVLLTNILPSDIAEELKLKGKAESRDYESVTILFSDFIDFTQTAQDLTASQLLEEVNTCFEAFDNIAEKYGIEKIKTIGDAYMAAGGLPLATRKSTTNTILTALEMQTYIINRFQERHASGLPGFRMRIGIHTGPVVAGIVGVKKMQFDVWGDTVNTASRMESYGEADKINISDATYQLIKHDPAFTFVDRGILDVKGKGPMRMWFVRLKQQ